MLDHVWVAIFYVHRHAPFVVAKMRAERAGELRRLSAGIPLVFREIVLIGKRPSAPHAGESAGDKSFR